MSKKWASKPALDENGEPILSSKGKPILKKSYSVLQDDFFRYMRDAGYNDVERGERSSSGGTPDSDAVQGFAAEQARLAELTEQNRQQEQQARRSASRSKKFRISRSMWRPSKRLRQSPSHSQTKVILERSEDMNRWQRRKYATGVRKRNQVAKGFGCGKQADCKTQGRDRRF